MPSGPAPRVTFAERNSPTTVEATYSIPVATGATPDLSAFTLTYEGFDHPVVDHEFLGPNLVNLVAGPPGAARAGQFLTYDPPPIGVRSLIGVPAITQIDFELG